MGLCCLFLSLVSVPLQHESCNRTFLPPNPSGNTYFLPFGPTSPPSSEMGRRGGEETQCNAVSSTDATIWCDNISMRASAYLSLFMYRVGLSHMSIKETSDRCGSCFLFLFILFNIILSPFNRFKFVRKQASLTKFST